MQQQRREITASQQAEHRQRRRMRYLLEDRTPAGVYRRRRGIAPGARLADTTRRNIQNALRNN